ncbi:MAG: hypothetical protein ACRDZY_04495, partial [Acidimicrobiales bacterium]
MTLPIPVASPGHPASSSVGAASQAASGRGAPAPNPPARIPAVDLSSCGAACGGVYPVVVSLERSGSAKVLDHLTTDMIFTDVLPTTKKLDLALALPVAAPPAASGRGVPQISDAAAASLRTLATALTSHPAAALTIVPSPLTLEALAHTSAPAGGSVLADVSAWAASPDHQVVGRPFAPVDVAALARAGLSGELAPQMLRGTAAIGTSLHVQPGPGTWESHTGLSEPALGLLAHLTGGGVHHLVLPAGALVPLFEKITPVQPFLLTGPAGTQVEAVAADAGLAAHLTDGPRPELAAHQLLADLSTIYFDQPNADYTRGVVLDVPPSWTPDATVLDTVLGALVHSPIVSPVTLDQLFGQVGLATFEGANVVRHLRSGTTAAGSGAASGGAPGASAAAGGLPPGSAGPGSGPGTSGLPASALAGHRKRLRAFLSSAKPGPSVVTGMENLMLVSESAGLSRATRTS